MSPDADTFLRPWRITRGMTLDYLAFLPDEVLDLRPTPAFRSIREQAVHLAELQGVYQLALRGEAVDYDRAGEFSPASDRPAAIVAAMAARDAEYAAHVDRLLPEGPALRLTAWHDLTLAAFDRHHCEHERLHQGQWITLTTLAHHPQPPGPTQLWAL